MMHLCTLLLPLLAFMFISATVTVRWFLQNIFQAMVTSRTWLFIEDVCISELHLLKKPRSYRAVLNTSIGADSPEPRRWWKRLWGPGESRLHLLEIRNRTSDSYLACCPPLCVGCPAHVSSQEPWLFPFSCTSATLLSGWRRREK